MNGLMGVYSRNTGYKVGISPGEDTSPLQGNTNTTHIHIWGKFNTASSPIACFWEVGENQKTPRGNTQGYRQNMHNSGKSL